jgi:hypothetical protein
LRLIKGHQRIVAIKDDGLNIHRTDHKRHSGTLQWDKSTAERVVQTMRIVSDATPGGAAVVRELLGPTEWDRQRSRPRWQPGYLLAVLEGDRPHGHACLAHERRRIGAAVLDVAVVELVALHAPARAALLGAAVEAAAAAGLAWLALAVAPADAPPGLAVCTLDTGLHMPAAPAPANLVLRPATPDDSEDLTALHAALAATRPLSPERTLADWRWLIAVGGGALQVLEDGRGRVAGYALRDAAGYVAEAHAADAGVGRGLLAALAVQGSVELRLGAAHPLALTALAHGGRLRVQAAAADVVMFCWGVVDSAAALTDLAPELGRRIAESRYRGWRGQINLETAGRTVALIYTGDAVVVQPDPPAPPAIAVKRIALEALPQAWLGYRALADLRADGALQCAEADLGLLDLIFPVLGV